MKHILLFCLFASFAFSQSVVINEVQPKNLSTYKGPFFFDQFPDWIELRNTTSTTINLDGYFLSDDVEDLTKWMFPVGTNLAANGYLLVHALGSNPKLSSSDTEGIITNFKLSSSGEFVTLSAPDGSIVHQIEYPNIQNDKSYGRLNDGTYTLMSEPSPNMLNIKSSAFTLLNVNIATNILSGIYNAPQTIEVTHEGQGVLYYTTDGTNPTTASAKYIAPIGITENTVLKIIAAKSDHEYSLIENRSYILNASHDLPVILLTSDNSYLNIDNKEVIDGRVNFQFIETDGTTAIDQYANFRASGKTSRSQPQLNGKIEADDLYGDDDFDYKMYPNKPMDEFNSFLLRNASQDWSETHMRDAFISRVLGQDNLADFPFEGYRPAVLYVNTKYQGIINVREDDDKDYVRHNYGLKDSEFCIKECSSVPEIEFTTDRELYEKNYSFNDGINLMFIISYSALNEYGFSQWYDISEKTKHRFNVLMHDFDATFGLFGEDYKPSEKQMDITNLLPYDLKAHAPYREEALQFIAAIINHIYNPGRTIEILNSMEEELESEIPAHAIVNAKLGIDQEYNRFNTPPFQNVTEWKANVEALRKDVLGRFDSSIFDKLNSEYDLDGAIQVTYNSSNIDQGIVRVHNVKSTNSTFTGTYFKNLPIKFTAEAKPGYMFVRWEGDFVSTAVDIAPTFLNNASITAVFKPITLPTTKLIINEVQGKNDSTIADEYGEYDDWIEIFNPYDEPIDLAGYYISDNTDEPLKWKIPDTDSSKTTVGAKGYLLLWADKDLEQGENHLDFKLKGSDQVVLTAPDAVTVIQQIAFKDMEADTSYGAEKDGEKEYIIFAKPTPRATNTSSLSTLSFDDLKNIKVYPNPTSSIVNITNIPKLLPDLKWELYNIQGQIIKSGNQTEINLEGFMHGLYILNINSSTNIKIIKK